ncbi:MAG: bifunctional metallophosphatase/5'-nucleotidase [Oscillospiraceae bacterium]|nr:bifunctional metallophosphatase/5'-nucleotidase [Oscillospiraceae bacterium]
MKKLIALVLSLAMVFSLVACGGTAAPTEDVAILFTNDVHTYIDNPLSYDVIAAVKGELATQYKNVLLVDAGDHAQGTVYGSMDFGKTVIELMNSAGYDLATLGNHEFDYSMTGTMDIIEWAEFPYISANFYKLENGQRTENVLDSFKIFELGGHKIAFVGATTPESFTKSTPAYFQNENGEYIYGISGGDNGEDLQADVQKAIDEAKKAGATTVIGLGHLGDDPSSMPWTSEETIAKISGLNAFIDGHSHSVVEGDKVADKDGKEVVLAQTGEYFDRIGLMVITAAGEIKVDHIEYEEILEKVKDENGNVKLNDKGEEIEEIVGYKLVSELYGGAQWPVYEDVKELKDGWIKKINDELGANIGKTALVLDNYEADGTRLVRKQETNTGDFAADALYYLFDDMDMDVDVAIMNGGGVRNKAITGDISFLTCKEIHTFGNVACLQTVTGQQVLDALEWGAQAVGVGESGGFLQVAGVTYTVDTSIPSTVQKDDKGVWTGGPTGEYRVKDVKVYNKDTNQYEDLDLNAKYNMAGNSYTLRSLGDGFNMFDGAINVLDYVMVDYMVLANYIMGFENGEIGATNSPLLATYPNMLLDYGTTYGSGRITVK